MTSILWAVSNRTDTARVSPPQTGSSTRPLAASSTRRGERSGKGCGGEAPRDAIAARRPPRQSPEGTREDRNSSAIVLPRDLHERCAPAADDRTGRAASSWKEEERTAVGNSRRADRRPVSSSFVVQAPGPRPGQSRPGQSRPYSKTERSSPSSLDTIAFVDAPQGWDDRVRRLSRTSPTCPSSVIEWPFPGPCSGSAAATCHCHISMLDPGERAERRAPRLGDVHRTKARRPRRGGGGGWRCTPPTF